MPRLLLNLLLVVAVPLLLCGCIATDLTLGAEYQRSLDDRRQSALTVKSAVTLHLPADR